MSFKPPSTAERLHAIGSVDDLPAALRAAFDPREDFDPIPAPGPADWLANHPERGQTFEDFVRSRPGKPDSNRKMLYLQPLGAFEEDNSPSLDHLVEYAAAFFGMEVVVNPPVSIKSSAFTSRTNMFTGNRQILTQDVLTMLKQKFPKDAFCILAITMEDLYPDPSWNFVFGQASLRERVGVYSFARYDPYFYGEPRDDDYGTLLLRRCCKVLAHETSHMFGLEHCIYFRCVMNGSNHLEESDSRPMHCCPVCLRKLEASLQFDVIEHYRRLRDVSGKLGFCNEARWYADRLKRVVAGRR